MSLLPNGEQNRFSFRSKVYTSITPKMRLYSLANIHVTLKAKTRKCILPCLQTATIWDSWLPRKCDTINECIPKHVKLVQLSLVTNQHVKSVSLDVQLSVSVVELFASPKNLTSVPVQNIFSHSLHTPCSKITTAFFAVSHTLNPTTYTTTTTNHDCQHYQHHCQCRPIATTTHHHHLC
jgi:hypothetical protein